MTAGFQWMQRLSGIKVYALKGEGPAPSPHMDLVIELNSSDIFKMPHSLPNYWKINLHTDLKPLMWVRVNSSNS